MAQVSKHPISKDVERRIFDIFAQAVADLNDPVDITDFFDDFISPVEKVMLSKRLSIAVMLAKGYTYDKIREVLRVSPPTIAAAAVSLKYSGKGYKRMVERILKAEKMDQFWQAIDDAATDVFTLGRRGSNIAKLRQGNRERREKNRKAF